MFNQQESLWLGFSQIFYDPCWNSEAQIKIGRGLTKLIIRSQRDVKSHANEVLVIFREFLLYGTSFVSGMF